jgi:DNA-binding response OmpR family regulator
MHTEETTRTTVQRVLVIEDDASVAKVLRLSLTAAGFEVSEATTGADALRLLDKGSAQAVVLDLVLPDDLGGSVLEWLRQVEPHALPVWIVISALDPREATSRYGPLGGNFFPKPFDPWDLITTLEHLLGARRKQPCSDMGTP